MRTKFEDSIFIYVHVKRYVYKYYRNKFDIPGTVAGAVNLGKFKEVMRFIRYRLVKPSSRYENRIRERGEYRQRTEVLAIPLTRIDENMGVELTQTDEMELSKMLESYVQQEMLLDVSLHYVFGMPLRIACEKWLSKEHMGEDDWSVNSMVRMCSRAHIYEGKNEFNEFVERQIENIVTRTMCAARSVVTNV